MKTNSGNVWQINAPWEVIIKKITANSRVAIAKQKYNDLLLKKNRKGRKKKTNHIYMRKEIFKIIFQISQKGG